MAHISKRFKFEASHSLPGHKGKCARTHGHSYKVIVGYEGNIRYANEGTDLSYSCGDDVSSDGMVFDFDVLSQVMDHFIETVLDHQDLNVVLSPLRTTAENIALVVLKHVLRSFSAHYPDTSRPDMRWTDDLAWYVKVQETETTEVQVNAEDLEMSDV